MNWPSTISNRSISRSQTTAMRTKNSGVISTVRRASYAVLGIILTMLPGRASADGTTDYLHYLVGSYAGFGASQARIIHHQVSGGGLDLAVTKTALDQLSEAITSIAAWTESIRRMQPAEENQKVGRHVAEIRALATKAEELMRTVGSAIDAAVEGGAETADDELAAQLKGPLSELYQTFAAIQKANDTIASKLELAEVPSPSS